jgi:preprotein translocase subunit SecD
MQGTEGSDSAGSKPATKLIILLVCAGLVSAGLAVRIGYDLFSGQHRSAGTAQPRTQLTVRLDTSAIPQLAVRALSDDVRRLMRETRIGVATLAPSGDSIEVTLHEGGDRAQAIAKLRELSRPAGSDADQFTISETGAGTLALKPTPAAFAAAADRALDQTIDVLGRRIGSLDLKPAFRREGNDRIVIEVPRQGDTSRLKAVIAAPGRLTFRFVDTSVTIEAAQSGKMPPQTEILRDKAGTSYLVEKRVAMSGENLTDAQPGFDQRTHEPIVSFRFNPAGTRQFASLTAEKIGQPFAVVLDDVVLAAPVIREPILGGSGQISGNFTTASANQLAILMRSGVLPAPLDVIGERALEARGAGIDRPRLSRLPS